jgi:hypothetical protein
MVVWEKPTAIHRRVGVTIVPTRSALFRLALGFRQFSFHLVEIALRNTPV